MSYLRVGIIQGKKYDNVVIGDRLDGDNELSITFEDIGFDVGSEERYLSLADIRAVRDHLTWVLLEGGVKD